MFENGSPPNRSQNYFFIIINNLLILLLRSRIYQNYVVHNSCMAM